MLSCVSTHNVDMYATPRMNLLGTHMETFAVTYPHTQNKEQTHIHTTAFGLGGSPPGYAGICGNQAPCALIEFRISTFYGPSERVQRCVGAQSSARANRAAIQAPPSPCREALPGCRWSKGLNDPAQVGAADGA